VNVNVGLLVTLYHVFAVNDFVAVEPHVLGALPVPQLYPFTLLVTATVAFT